MGGDTGSTNSTMSPAIKKVFLYVIPVVTMFFSSFWPAGLQLMLCCTGLVTITQAAAFKQPWLRNLLGMHPLPSPSSARPQDGYAGVINRPGSDTVARKEKPGFANPIETLTEAMADIIKLGEDFVRKQQKLDPKPRSSKTDVSQAKFDEQKRQKEIAQRRFEQAQAQESRRENRKTKKFRR